MENILLFKGEKFKALKFLEKSVDKSPHNCSFWLDLAFCYFTLRNLQMAELCLSTAQKINFDHKRCFMLSALLFQEKSMHKETLEIYKRAMELYPNDNEIMTDLAVFYLRIGKKLEGYELYNHIDYSKRINLYNLIDTEKISNDNNPLKAIQNLEDLK